MTRAERWPAEGWPAARWPADPYPGARPDFSFVQVEETVVPLGPDGLLDGLDLDAWLADRGAPPMAERLPVLCYGSNACPSKLAWLRARHGLAGPAVLTACTVTGMAAAWCTGTRQHDGVVPATLIEHPGVEEHFVCWLAPGQRAAFDACEGAPHRYRLAALAHPVHARDGQRVPGVHAYLGVHPSRLPRRDRHGAALLMRAGPP